MVRASLIALFQFSFFPGSFVARLLGQTLDVRKGSPRKIEVSFKAPRAGTFRGTLTITFRDKARRDEKFTEFTVTRELRGRAILPGPASGQAKQPASRRGLLLEYTPNTVSQPINDRVDDDARILVDEEFLDCGGTGISVSHADGLDFGIVERKRPNEPFATPSSLLTVKHEDDFPAVKFIEGRTKATDGSDRK
jgi:hypothetical protein